MRSVLLPLLFLAACATDPADTPLSDEPAAVAKPPALTDPSGTCRSEALASFVGQQRSEELGARILKATGTREIRWVPPGTMVTMDFRGDRVTVYLDSAGRIERASCG